MNCPRCGASTTQSPGGSWYCSNCGWSSGYAPPPAAVEWLESKPVKAYEAVPSGVGYSLRPELFDNDSDFRGGGIGQDWNVCGMFSVKYDHHPKCTSCTEDGHIKQMTNMVDVEMVMS